MDTLFYIAANDTLGCIYWSLGDLRDCDVLANISPVIVAPDSYQLFVGWVPFNDSKGVFLMYQSPSVRQVIMYGYLNANLSYIWRNETDTFNSLLAMGYPATPEIHIAAACTPCHHNSNTTVSEPHLYCFTKNDYRSKSVHDGGVVHFQLYINETVPGDLIVASGSSRR